MKELKQYIYTARDFKHLGLTRENCFIIELLNNTASPNLSIAKATVGPNDITEWHTLKDTEEYYYVLEGRGRMFVDGDEAGEIGVGMVVHIPPNTSQRVENIGKYDLVFLCICTPRFEVGNYE